MLRRSCLPGLVALCVLAVLPASAGAAEAAPGRVVVKFAPSASGPDRTDARGQVDGTITTTIAPRTQVLDVPDGTVHDAVRTLEGDGDVAWAEPVYRMHAQAAPNDPVYGQQWAWHTIDAEDAWGISTGTNVVIGIVDSGVTTGNRDFAGTSKIWTNPAHGDGRCINTSVDDLHGCDFVNDDGNPADDKGHGTAVASEAAANFNDNVGMAGVAPAAQIMPVKVLDNTGSGTSDEVAAGLRYAADHGAKIVNVSIGGPRSQVISDAIAAYPGTLFVVSAGNDGENNDNPVHAATYPCTLPLANILCVGASDDQDAFPYFTNWGPVSVDVMAPGVNIQGASYTNGPVGSGWSGTSMASPITAGVAALLLAHDPTATAAQLKAAIMTSVDPVPAFVGTTVSGGRVDAYHALLAIDGTPPAPANVTAPSISGAADTNSTLTATAGTWTGATSTSFQWQYCSTAGGPCADIDGRTGATYQPVAADNGYHLRVVVTAHNATGTSTAASSAVGPVRSIAPPRTITAIAPPAPTPKPDDVTPQPPALRITLPAAITVRGATAQVSIACSAACRGTVRLLLPGGATAGSAQLRGTGTVTVKLSSRAGRTLKATRRLKVTAVVTVRGKTTRRAIVLRRG
jgi:subtilisin family serine protease